MAQEIQNTLTFNHYIIHYGKFCLLKLDNEVSLLSKKNLFPRFLDTKKLMTSNKQITMTNKLQHQKSVIKMDFLIHGFWYYHIKIIRLGSLQHQHQIRVNTWTGFNRENIYQEKVISFLEKGYIL